MAIKLGELFYQFTSKGFEKTQGQINQADEKAKKTGVSLGGLKTALIALGSTAVIYAIKKLVDEFVAYGVEIDKANKITGISVEKLQELKYAADQEHASFEQLQIGLKMLTRQMGNAKEKSEESVKAFRDIGTSAIDANGNLRDVYDVFLDVADAVRNAKSETEASSIALKFLGRSGSEMVPFLRLGKEELEKLFKTARDLGVVLNAETIKGVKAFSDSMKELDTAITGLKFTLAKELTGPAKEFIDWLTKTYIWLKKVETEQLINNTKLEIQHLGVAFKQGFYTLDGYNKKLIELYDKLQELQGTVAEFSVYPRILATETDRAKDSEFEITDAMRVKYKLYQEWLELEKAMADRTGETADATEDLIQQYEMQSLVQSILQTKAEEAEQAEKDRMQAMWDSTLLVRNYLVPVLYSLYDSLTQGGNVWQNFSRAAVDALKRIMVQMAAMATLAIILSRLVPGFGGFMKIFGTLMGYQTPGGDAFAAKEGRDFGRFFMGGFQESFAPALANINARQQPMNVIVHTGDPSTYVEFVSKLPSQYKSKIFRDVTKKAMRLEE